MNKPARRPGQSAKTQSAGSARPDGRGRPSNRTAKASDGAKPFGKKGGLSGASASGKAGPGRAVTGPRTDAKAAPGKRGRVSAAEYVPPPRPSTRSKPSASAALASGPDFTGGYGEAKPRRSRVTGTRTLDLMDPTEPQRLSKIMAAKGLCSRREADYLIEKGWVRVNGVVVNELGSKVLPSDKIDLDSRAKDNLSKQVTILYHKPIGVVSGQPEGRYKSAMECIDDSNQADRRTSQPFSPNMLKGLAPAGRLDIDSTGLLVLTQDGRIARQLIDEHSLVEKEYLVRVEGELRPNGLEMLRSGISLDGEALKPAKVSWLNEDQLKFILIEGKKRQIRRMCEIVGLRVTGLKRIRIGRIMLGDLPPGQWRLLRPEERFE
jgi:23S rRNA pseudouridine2604 synthase